MNKKYVLAIDQSTQGTKAILFDEHGNLFCRTDLAHKQIVNEKGWVSHDLEEIYENTVQVVKNLLDKANVSKEDVACLGISNQRETAAAWSKTTGQPLDHAIVWQCARAESICKRVESIEGTADYVRKATGMPLSPYFTASKFAWLLENSKAVKDAKINDDLCLGTIDSYLLYRLTGNSVHKTDYSNASRTQLLNIGNFKWDNTICEWFGIDVNDLPEVVDSSYNFGHTDFEGFFETPIPICGAIGDSQGALFGQGCIEKGMVKATYGTGSSIMMNMGNVKPETDSGLVTSLAWGLNGQVEYVFEGNINYSGAVITWLKDDVQLINTPGETESLAQAANPQDTTYLIPAFSGLGAPYWKSDAKAMLYGMSRTTGKNEIVKAALDSIVYQITDIVTLMGSEDGVEIKELCVDGGPTHNSYLMQFQSDIIGSPVTLARCEESSAQGAAFMAGLCHGIYQKEQLFIQDKKKQFVPMMPKDLRNEKYDGWKDAIGRVL